MFKENQFLFIFSFYSVSNYTAHSLIIDLFENIALISCSTSQSFSSSLITKLLLTLPTIEAEEWKPESGLPDTEMFVNRGPGMNTLTRDLSFQETRKACDRSYSATDPDNSL